MARSWVPSEKALAWGREQIEFIRHKSWLVTRNGFYEFDHIEKSIALIARSPDFEEEQWDKHVSLFNTLGYRLFAPVIKGVTKPCPSN